MNIFPSILRNFLLLIFAFLNTIGFAQKDIKIEIDNYLQKTQKIFEVPGVAVAIVKDRKVIFAKGFGVQSLSKKLLLMNIVYLPLDQPPKPLLLLHWESW